jgi:type II secretory pathway component GspD/PulD (secretin)
MLPAPAPRRPSARCTRGQRPVIDRAHRRPPAPRPRHCRPAAQALQQRRSSSHHGHLLQRAGRQRAGPVQRVSPAAPSSPRRVQNQTISAELRGVPWDLALEAILEANMTCACTPAQRRHGRRGCGPAAERRETEPLVTQAFPIQYISADSIRQPCRACSRRTIGRVTVNTASNALLITDTASAVERLARDHAAARRARRRSTSPRPSRSSTARRSSRSASCTTSRTRAARSSTASSRAAADLDGDGVVEPVDRDARLLGGNSVAALGNANYRVAAPPSRSCRRSCSAATA